MFNRDGPAEVHLSVPRVERYSEKTLAKIPTIPDAYMWEEQPQVNDSTLFVQEENILIFLVAR